MIRNLNMKLELNMRPTRVVPAALLWMAVTAGAAHAMGTEDIYQATRIEIDAGQTDSRNAAGLRADGWIGSDENRFAWRAEATRRAGQLQDAEVQALYSRYIAPFWDLQAGLRHETQPQSRNYGVVGVRGLAPYAFDVDLQAFVRSDGKLFARTRVEYDLLFTNRLVARPFFFADWALSSVPADGIKAGATSSEWGVNLRYELSRAVAPYLELSRQWQHEPTGGASVNSARLGLRLIF